MHRNVDSEGEAEHFNFCQIAMRHLQGTLKKGNAPLTIADRTARIVIEPCPRFEPRFEPWDLAIHYGVRLTFCPGNYIWSFSYGFGVVVRDIWEWRPGFYTEFRYKSYEHSGLAWEAIFKKVLVLTSIPRLPCSFFQEHVPKIIQAPRSLTPGAARPPPAFPPYQKLEKADFQYFQDVRN